jgi:hypothetical protein
MEMAKFGGKSKTNKSKTNQMKNVGFIVPYLALNERMDSSTHNHLCAMGKCMPMGGRREEGRCRQIFFTVSSKVRRMVRLRGNGWSLGAVPPAPTYSLMLVETKAKKFSRRDEGQRGVEC